MVKFGSPNIVPPLSAISSVTSPGKTPPAGFAESVKDRTPPRAPSERKQSKLQAKEPIDPDADDEKMPSQAGFPGRTIVVLQTQRPGTQHGWEFRVGLVTEDDFKIGLRCKHEEGSKCLNPVITQRCFAQSKIYYNQYDAEKQANEDVLPYTRAGVKVLQFFDTYPGRPCR